MLETRAAAGGQCVRCGRKLKDPVSVERKMGQVCWGKSQGDIFEHDLEASEAEWARREHLLRHGGEIDFGVNWQWVDLERLQTHALVLPQTMRVSLRFNEATGMFEAYGQVGDREVVVSAHADLKDAYRAAINLGPASEAAAYRYRRGVVGQRRREVA